MRARRVRCRPLRTGYIKCCLSDVVVDAHEVLFLGYAGRLEAKARPQGGVGRVPVPRSLEPTFGESVFQPSGQRQTRTYSPYCLESCDVDGSSTTSTCRTRKRSAVRSIDGIACRLAPGELVLAGHADRLSRRDGQAGRDGDEVGRGEIALIALVDVVAVGRERGLQLALPIGASPVA